jgi:molybdopterin-containing oxidoreductase family iron-sulfur binding subunit
MSDDVSFSRRQFFAGASAFTVTVLAPGLVLHAAPASSKNRWGILVDVTRCDAECEACVKACNDEFGITSFGRPTTDSQWIRKMTVTDPFSGSSKSFPVMCQHCKHPPCVNVCPTGASFIRADGIVLVNRHLCIGCRYCIIACPYKARSFVHQPIKDQKPYAPRGIGTVEACTLCVHRIDEGRPPACVETCGSDGRAALLFGDLNDPDSEISKRIAAVYASQIRPDLKTDPAMRYYGI